MGGKSYFCDYCKCYMKNDINVRKVHNSGLIHTIAKTNYNRKYEDARVILAEENVKVPCTRYFKGLYCKFELFCQFSHYNDKQLQQLRKIANRLTEKAKHKRVTKALHPKWQRLLPWNRLSRSMNALKARKKRKNVLKQLPASLKTINLNKFNEDSFKNEWG